VWQVPWWQVPASWPTRPLGVQHHAAVRQVRAAVGVEGVEVVLEVVGGVAGGVHAGPPLPPERRGGGGQVVRAPGGVELLPGPSECQGAGCRVSRSSMPSQRC